MFDENLFSERFLIKSTRLKNWDYTNQGYYFITICTRYKYPYFGNINNGKNVLSNIGKIADKCWRDISLHFNNVILDEYIVMPNHMHGIVRIVNKNCIDSSVETCHGMSLQNTTKDGMSLQYNINNQNRKQYNKFSKPISKSIPMIINHYKGACTREINKLPNQSRFFHWQPRYYDRVIRNDYQLNKIRQYIQNNPKNWRKDRNFNSGAFPPDPKSSKTKQINHF